MGCQIHAHPMSPSTPKMQNIILNEEYVQRVDGYSFEIDWIRFGMEICLNHDAKNVLWMERQKNDADFLVEIHLIVSEGMSIQQSVVHFKSKSLVILTGGEGSSAACQRTDNDENEDSPERSV
jgi:hypothetical protein